MSDNNSPKKGKSVVGFLREVRGETKHITWPTRKETIRMTAIVIAITVVISIYLGGLDYIYTYLMGLII
jgi:preprotein translocase subunit SecE